MTSRSVTARASRAAGAAASLALLAAVTACSAASPAAAPGSAAAPAGAAPASTQPAASGSVDVCTLLSAQQASAADDVSYVKTTPSQDMCSYTGADPNNDFFIIITPNAGSSAAWKDQLSTLQEDAGEAPTAIPGLGDRAAGGGTEIGVQSGSDIIDVHGADATSQHAAAFPRAIALARAVMAALG